MKNKFYNSLQFLLVILILYVMLACVVFQVRHPWATQMEVFLNIPKALIFEKVSYREMRERD